MERHPVSGTIRPRWTAPCSQWCLSQNSAARRPAGRTALSSQGGDTPAQSCRFTFHSRAFFGRPLMSLVSSADFPAIPALHPLFVSCAAALRRRLRFLVQLRHSELFSEFLRCSGVTPPISCRDRKAKGISRMDSRLTVSALAVLRTLEPLAQSRRGSGRPLIRRGAPDWFCSCSRQCSARLRTS